MRVEQSAARRVALPAVEELFGPAVRAVAAEPEPHPDPPPDRAPDRAPTGAAPRSTSGRVRHDEKMTVYVTAAELDELEHARLALRSTHGVRVDRGRLVREALAVVLEDFEARGGDSVLVQRLRRP